MQKKVFSLAIIVLLLPVFSIIVYADFAGTLNDIANFLKSNSLTGYITANQIIQAEDTSKVTRAGKWSQSGPGTEVVLISSSEDSTLSFSFTGTSIGVVVYRKDPGKAVLTIDGETRDIDTSRMTSSNCWSGITDYCEIPVASDLANIQHNVVLKKSNAGNFHVDKFLINTGTTAAPSTTTCTDSDGTDYYTAGAVYSSAYSSEGGQRADRCDTNVIVEQICSGNTPSSVRYTCPNGCENGKCREAASCNAYQTQNYTDGVKTSGRGVVGYDTLTEGPKCSNGEWYWCTRASQNTNCFGCYTGNLCSTGTGCQASPYFDYNNDGTVTDSDVDSCYSCIGTYSAGSCWKCDFNGDCGVTTADIELQRGKKTLNCDSPEIRDSKYVDGVKKTDGTGTSGYDTVTYGPICRNNAWYWCTQSSKNTGCFGCYTGNSCTQPGSGELKPDLTITEITLNPASPSINKDIAVQVTFKNIGNAATRIIDYKIEASVNVLIAGSTFDGELAPGETATVTAKVRYGTAGETFIRAKADKNNIVSELKEDNNELSKTIRVTEQETTQQPPTEQCAKPAVSCLHRTHNSINVTATPVSGATSYLFEWRKAQTQKWTGCSSNAECGYTTTASSQTTLTTLDSYSNYEIRTKVEAGSCIGVYSDSVYCGTTSPSSPPATDSRPCEIFATQHYTDGVLVRDSGRWFAELFDGGKASYIIAGKRVELSLDFVGSSESKFTLNGFVSPPLHEGDSTTIDGIRLEIRNIVYENLAGGTRKVSFVLVRDNGGVPGYDTLTEGPSCKDGSWYWCTRSSLKPACGGCYYGNSCIRTTVASASQQPELVTSCDALSTVPYADGIANGAGTEIKYGFDTLIDGPKCNNGIVYWCTKSSENSRCAKCDVGSCCGGDAYLTGVENVECNGAIIQERYNPRYPRCRINSCQTRVQAAISPQLTTTPSAEPQAQQKCQLGFRQSSQYCDSDGTFRQQKSEGENCNNNFECSTNSCASAKCVDLQKQLEEQRSLMQQILSLLGKLFG